MLVDRIQRDFECCGAGGPEDWMNSSYNKNSSSMEKGIGSWLGSFRIPSSCCLLSVTNCEQSIQNLKDIQSVRDLVTNQTIFKTGCLDKFENFIKDKWQWILITGGILIGVQVFALIFACVLCCAISRVGDK